MELLWIYQHDVLDLNNANESLSILGLSSDTSPIPVHSCLPRHSCRPFPLSQSQWEYWVGISPCIHSDMSNKSSQGFLEANVWTAVCGRWLVHQTVHLPMARLLVHNIMFSFLINKAMRELCLGPNWWVRWKWCQWQGALNSNVNQKGAAETGEGDKQ